MKSLADQMLIALIAGSQKTPFRARGSYSNVPVEQQATATPCDKSKVEAADYSRLFKFFPQHDLRRELAGKTVLDFGSGYGGRTLEYARHCGAREVYGTDVVTAGVAAGNELAAEWGIGNVRFDLCDQHHIPYNDGFFDLAVTFDVLEHVADPRIALSELKRVLKAGGRLYAVFPPYRGMFSHHLDYLTLFPALHLLFDPRRIVRIVNQYLTTKMPNLGVGQQPNPSLSYTGDRFVLPTLNGMRLKDFLVATESSGLTIEYLRCNSVVEAVMGFNSLVARSTRPLMALPSQISEIFCFNVSCVLRRP